MGFLVFIILIINLGLGILVSAVSIMLLTAFLHSSWWTAIPVLDFNQSFLIGLFLSCFAMATTLSVSVVKLNAAIFQAIFALAVVPFLLPWVVGELNNNLIQAMPDITYGTSMLFTIIGLALSIPAVLLMKFTEVISESS